MTIYYMELSIDNDAYFEIVGCRRVTITGLIYLVLILRLAVAVIEVTISATTTGPD